MDTSIFDIMTGKYKIVQLMLDNHVPGLYWGPVDYSFEMLTKGAGRMYGFGLQPGPAGLDLAGIPFSVAGVGFCQVHNGRSTKTHMLRLLFGGRSETYGLTIDLDHLTKWAEWLKMQDIHMDIEIGAPYGDSISGTGLNVPVSITKQISKDIHGGRSQPEAH